MGLHQAFKQWKASLCLFAVACSAIFLQVVEINGSWVEVHGAGAQRSDPKFGDLADYPYGRGPQGDAIRIYNFVRLVRNTE